MAATATTKAKPAAAERDKQIRRAAMLCKHLSDATRWHIIQSLWAGEKHVGALCQELKQSQPAVSHHIALLRHGGVIEPRRQGKNNFYRLTAETGKKLGKVCNTFVEPPEH